jgi:hypothetical protein
MIGGPQQKYNNFEEFPRFQLLLDLRIAYFYVLYSQTETNDFNWLAPRMLYGRNTISQRHQFHGWAASGRKWRHHPMS